MTDRAYGATVAKRRLSRRLVTMREDVGLKPNQVDDQLGWKRGKLARIERNDWILPNTSYIRDLLRVYSASGSAQAEVMDLVERASARAWWRVYAQPGDPNRVYDNEFPGFEFDAARISVYMPLVLPGLLQSALTSPRTWPPGPGRRNGRNGRGKPGCAASRSSTGPTGPRPASLP